MSIISMHLRWDALSAEQRRAASRALDHLQHDAVSGCHSASVRDSGTTLLATLVWEAEEKAVAFTRGPLAALVAAERMAEPQTVCFAIPDIFGAGYRPTPLPVPAPRPASESALRQQAPVGG